MHSIKGISTTVVVIAIIVVIIIIGGVTYVLLSSTSTVTNKTTSSSTPSSSTGQSISSSPSSTSTSSRLQTSTSSVSATSSSTTTSSTTTSSSALSCSSLSSQTTTQSSASSTTSLTFQLEFTPSGRDAPFYVGISNGYYSSQGLKVSVVSSQGSGATATAVASGTVQMGMVDYGTFLNSVVHAENITAVMLFEDKSGFMLLSLSPIPNPSSIEGKTIGATAGNAIINMLPVLMAVNNLKNNYTLVSVGASALIPGLYSNQFNIGTSIVDGNYATYLSQLPSGDHLYNLNFSQWGINVPAYVIVANNAFLRQNPSAVAGFIKGTIQSVDYSICNPSHAATLMLNQNPGLSQTVILTAWNSAVTLIETPYALTHYGQFNMTQAQSAEQLVLRVGYNVTSSKIPTLSSILTNSYVPANQSLPR